MFTWCYSVPVLLLNDNDIPKAWLDDVWCMGNEVRTGLGLINCNDAGVIVCRWCIHTYIALCNQSPLW